MDKSNYKSSTSSGARAPLATIQAKGNSVNAENEMVGRKVAPVIQKKSVGEGLTNSEKEKLAGRVSKSSSNGKAKRIAKLKFVDQAIQTLTENLELITEEHPPPQYWRELAETREKALEAALIENEYLHKQIEELEMANSELEDIVEHAKGLAEMIQSIGDDDEEDSGISAQEF